MSDHACWNVLDLVIFNLVSKAAGIFIPPLLSALL